MKQKIKQIIILTTISIILVLGGIALFIASPKIPIQKDIVIAIAFTVMMFASVTILRLYLVVADKEE